MCSYKCCYVVVLDGSLVTMLHCVSIAFSWLVLKYLSYLCIPADFKILLF